METPKCRSPPGSAASIEALFVSAPGILDNLLSLAGPWAVSVGQSLTAPLSTVRMTLLYWELRGRGEEKVEEAEKA